MTSATEEARQLLAHYVERAWEAAGLGWNSDNEAEIDRIFDPIRDLERRVEALESEEA